MFSKRADIKNRADFLKSIDYDTALRNEMSFDSLKKISPILDEYNALAHTIYVALNKNLSLEDKVFHQLAAAKLMEKEKRMYEETMKIFNSTVEPAEEVDTEDEMAR